MTPKELRERGKPLLGGRGWRKRLARAINVDYATVKRWTADSGKVPTYVAALLECLELIEKTGHAFPQRFRDEED